jgi:two-component system CheB/CheR fusion protein
MTDFPIVGVGASAGGLAAYDAFFRGMPAGADPEMAFVLLQHLAPDHDSMLVELVQRATRLKVLLAVNGLLVQPGCVYVIPPGFDLIVRQGRLQLVPPPAPRSPRLPIDVFFKSLAEEQGERAIGVVLSGTGRDGTLGLRAIKSRGGKALVQTLASAEFDGMPRSAIEAGLADAELDPQQMPAQLIAWVEQGGGASPALPPPVVEQAVLAKIHLLLRGHTGHDFSQYKSSTVSRRIERRMLHHQIAALDEYLQFLQHNPAEVDALFADLLIGVTHFFRDQEAFQALADAVIAPLFKQRTAGQAVRVWCVGCSTGEEAYSVAMLLAEAAQTAASQARVQVFATDIDRRAIDVARTGVYPRGIASDVSAERLARHFLVEPSGDYRIHKRIRDSVVFSEQDVILDPPFSRLDLVVCRNLLIYLDEPLQKRLIPMFHYALKPGGALFLGSAEGIGEFGELFTPLERSAKVYRRETLADDRRAVPPRFTLPTTASALNGLAGGVRLGGRQGSLRDVAERALILHLDPVAALVTAQGDVVYLHGRSGQFLEPAQGAAQVGNILKMAREGLAPSLSATLHKAVQTGVPATAKGLRVKTNGDIQRVDLCVRPLPAEPAAGDRPLYLVVLSLAAAPPRPVAADVGAAPLGADAALRIAELQAELLSKDAYLQSAHTQLQRVNEELTSINEEAQSINEELQSTNEELETSKEELQSVNEELVTANLELEDKIGRLTQANNDMNNLLAGTGIGTVFVDHGLRVLRFTPAMRAIINLIPEDAGRPLAHLASNLVGYPSLLQDTQAVLDTLVPREHEVQTADGRWYALRIQPYRTLENVIEGAVISFVEISDSVRIREELKRVNAHMRHAAVVRDTADAIAVQALDGRILAWNPAAERLYGWTEAEALQLQAEDRIPPGLQAEEAQELARLSAAAPLLSHRSQRLTKQGRLLEVSVAASKLLDESGAVYAIAVTERALIAAPAAP